MRRDGKLLSLFWMVNYTPLYWLHTVRYTDESAAVIHESPFRIIPCTFCGLVNFYWYRILQIFHHAASETCPSLVLSKG